MIHVELRARDSHLEIGEDMKLNAEQTAHLVKKGIAVTDDSFKYSLQSITSKVVAIWNGQQFVDSVDFEEISGETSVGIILDRTNFYAEGGGQIFDVGTFTNSNSSSTFQVENVQSYAGTYSFIY
jgi:alanyl-tRNA synthetase